MTTCFCALGYVLDNSTGADFPKTGVCENLRTKTCTKTQDDYCITNTDGWGVCPYCRVNYIFNCLNDFDHVFLRHTSMSLILEVN